MRIGIDLMGSDRSPIILFEAIEQAIHTFPQVNFVVFATQAAKDEILSHSKIPAHLSFQTVTETVEMHDEPLFAIRRKKNSSLVIGLKLLKKRFLDGFITAGNTGALIAGSTLSLPRFPEIKRPALLATMPTQKGAVAVIDVGGNLSCKAQNLFQFALLGVAYQRCMGIDKPKIGLLNIGVESKKGTSEVRQAYELLQQMSQKGDMEFMGNVEGREVFQGAVDVLVTDGFTGNVLLKTSEGVSSFILQKLHHTIPELIPLQSETILKAIHRQFDYEEYDGAILCGIDRVVVKCHGQSSPKGLFQGIKRAIELVQKGFLSQIKEYLASSRP